MAAEPFLMHVLADVAKALNRQGVNYALAGGLAYSALIEPRATTDLDLLIRLPHPSPDAIRELFAPLFESVLPHDRPMIFKAILIWRAIAIREGREVVSWPRPSFFGMR